MTQKPWGGRFEGETAKAVEDFTTSLSFDQRLARQDIAGSMAHADMLAKQGIITAAEGEQIVAGLAGILEEIEAGEFEFDPGPEPERPGGPGPQTLPGRGGDRAHQ